MELNAVVSLSRRTADTRKGIPRPNEYDKSRNNPLTIVPDVEAIISAEPRKAPIHGVKLIEYITPNKKAENMLSAFLPPFIPLRNGNLTISR